VGPLKQDDCDCAYLRTTPLTPTTLSTHLDQTTSIIRQETASDTIAVKVAKALRSMRHRTVRLQQEQLHLPLDYTDLPNAPRGDLVLPIASSSTVDSILQSLLYLNLMPPPQTSSVKDTAKLAGRQKLQLRRRDSEPLELSVHTGTLLNAYNEWIAKGVQNPYKQQQSKESSTNKTSATTTAPPRNIIKRVIAPTAAFRARKKRKSGWQFAARKG